MGDHLLQERKKSMNDLMDFENMQLKEVTHEKMPCFIPQEIPLTNQRHLENERNACVIY
jgi:hypothetical protein